MLPPVIPSSNSSSPASITGSEGGGSGDALLDTEGDGVSFEATMKAVAGQEGTAQSKGESRQSNSSEASAKNDFSAENANDEAVASAENQQARGEAGRPARGEGQATSATDAEAESAADGGPLNAVKPIPVETRPAVANANEAKAPRVEAEAVSRKTNGNRENLGREEVLRVTRSVTANGARSTPDQTSAEPRPVADTTGSPKPALEASGLPAVVSQEGDQVKREVVNGGKGVERAEGGEGGRWGDGVKGGVGEGESERKLSLEKGDRVTKPERQAVSNGSNGASGSVRPPVSESGEAVTTDRAVRGEAESIERSASSVASSQRVDRKEHRANRGMDGAKSAGEVKGTEQSGPATAGTEQTLPKAATNVPLQAETAELPEGRGAKDLSRGSMSPALSGVSAGRLDRVAGMESMGNVNAAARVEEASSLQSQMSSIALQFRQVGRESMRVVMRPDGQTELQLQLQMRDGTIDVEAVFRRGDIGHLSAQWGQLQQAMLQQGVRVGALQDAGETSFSDAANPEDPGMDRGREGAERGEKEEFRGMPSKERGADRKAARVEPATTNNGADRALEMWA